MLQYIMSISQNAQYQSPVTGTPKWNAAIINIINYTCGFPALAVLLTHLLSACGWKQTHTEMRTFKIYGDNFCPFSCGATVLTFAMTFCHAAVNKCTYF